MSNLQQNNNISKVCIINDLSGYSTSNTIQKISIESMAATNLIDGSLTGSTDISGNLTIDAATTINGALTLNGTHNIIASKNYTLGTPTFRNLDTTYGATSGPVQINFSSVGTGGNWRYQAVAEISPDNSTWYVIGRQYVEWSSVVRAGNISFNLPSGWYYKITKTSITGTGTEDMTYYEFPIS